MRHVAAYLGVPGIEVVAALVGDGPVGMLTQQRMGAALGRDEGIGHHPGVDGEPQLVAGLDGIGQWVVPSVEEAFARDSR